jgi:hypothetical protein
MFSDDDLAMLNREGLHPGTRCNPLPDLLPNVHCIPCYPLADVLDLSTVQNMRHKDIQSFFANKLSSFRVAGIFKECGNCPQFKTDLCVGGCLAGSMRRMRNTSFSVISKPDCKTGSIQQLSTPVVRQKYKDAAVRSNF